MAESLTPSRRARARRDFDFYNALNSASFVLLSGNFITLFALKLGASNALIGLLNALAYASFFFMPLGKRLIKTKPILEVFGKGWLWRYLIMIPCLSSPLLVAWGATGMAFAFLLLGVAGFNFFRGVGMIGNNPVLAELAEGRDRGAFLAGLQVTSGLASLATNLVLSLILGRSAGILIFTISIGVGIATGIIGVAFLYRLPEPIAYRPPVGSGLWRMTRDSFKEKPYRAFMVVFLLLAFTAGMARSFLPVYAKEVYAQGDDIVMILSFVASLGAVAVGLISRLAIDRLGAKPLYVIYTAIAGLSMVPAIFSPALPSVILLLSGIFFFSSFGLTGEESASQTYYFGLVPRERTLDLAVAYFIVQGLGGSLGSTLGGILLDSLRALGLGAKDAFRAFYGATALLFVFAILGMGRLVRLGSASVRESLGALFSIRDLKAFDLLTRLDQSRDPEEELRLIHELGESGSPRTQGELLAYLSSPRFELRMEALLALEALPSLNERSLAALATEVEARATTTGYVAARILGKRGGPAAVPILRRALDSSEALLQGAAVIALARLGDRESIPGIETLLRSTSHPRARIQAAYALEIFGKRESIPALVASLRSEDPPAFVSDEIVLAMASILGIMGVFYPLYDAFSEDEENALSLLRLSADERLDTETELSAFGAALAMLFAEKSEGAPMARLLLEADLDPGVSLVLADALFDSTLGYRGFRFFTAAYYLFGRDKPPPATRMP